MNTSAWITRTTLGAQLRRVRVGWLLTALLLLLGALWLTTPQAVYAQTTVIKVDTDAPGLTHDGLSWTSAYTTVQVALDLANANPARTTKSGWQREALRLG